ncbi:MAG TPA: serine/threonine-protein kinase [Kofleriaceae bacterium]|nr:serine/threonine-protein kinase [Kofleriaceae bacterium]
MAAPTIELRQNVEIGEWRTGKLLGRGGQGAVWVVRSTKTDNMPPRALKTCFATEELPRKRFEREIELLGKCDSPYIVKMFDSDAAWVERVAGIPPFAFYVSEECAGSLEAMAVDLDVGPRLALFRDACRAVIYLHTRPEPIIHRDIKPPNFLIAREHRRLVLTDFGIARELLASTLTATQEVVGSKFFRAPEILNGDSGSVQSDVYSLGRLLEWLLTSDVSRSFDTRPVPRGKDLSDDACDALDRVIAKATQIAPANRFASVQEMLDQLPDLWLAIKPAPAAAQVPADHDGRSVLHKALDLARAKDHIGWRQLEGSLRSSYPQRVRSWRDENMHNAKESERFGIADRLVGVAAGRIALSLAGLYSQDPALVDQRRVLEDLLAIPQWERGTSSFADDAPRGLAYLFHHLYGALCCELGRIDLALPLAEVQFPARDAQYGEMPLWRLPDMHGSKVFTNRITAWDYTSHLRERIPWLEAFFAMPDDFAVGLTSYSMLMCLLELCYDAGKILPSLKSGQIKVVEMFDVPPMFGSMTSDVRRKAVARTFGSAQTVGLVMSRTRADPQVVKEVWPNWKPSLSRAYFGNAWHGTDELRLGDLPL